MVHFPNAQGHVRARCLNFQANSILTQPCGSNKSNQWISRPQKLLQTNDSLLWQAEHKHISENLQRGKSTERSQGPKKTAWKHHAAQQWWKSIESSAWPLVSRASGGDCDSTQCKSVWLSNWVVPLCVSAAAAPICRWLFWPPFYSSPLHTDAGCCPCWCWGWVLHSPGLSSTSWLPKTQAPLRNTKQPSNCHSHRAGWQQTAEKSDSLWK